ncbi:MAG TPA: hypothetical protein VNU68_21840 [Verrucomicrobiae bacterium]|nr:hypothetical protein [Verrucomicrobiae bacterium]
MSHNRVVPVSSPLRIQTGAGRAFRRAWFIQAAILVGLIGSVATGLRLQATEPQISRIEPFLTDQVTIHFDTDANRTYQLQFLHLPTGNWSNLFVAPKIPFPNHYIVVDYRTNQSRLYRLRVTP